MRPTYGDKIAFGVPSRRSFVRRAELAWLISASIVRLFSRRPLGIEQPRNRAIARKLRSLAIACARDHIVEVGPRGSNIPLPGRSFRPLRELVEVRKRSGTDRHCVPPFLPVPPSPSLIVTVSLATRVRRTKNEGVAEGRTSQSEVGTTLVRRTNVKASAAVTWSGFLYDAENSQ
jgi:hypothetical protein